jgi:hypothetical protein
MNIIMGLGRPEIEVSTTPLPFFPLNFVVVFRFVLKLLLIVVASEW